MTFLHKRGIARSPVCPLSLKAPKTTNHMLWSCKRVRSWWLDCPLFQVLSGLCVMHFQDKNLSKVAGWVPPSGASYKLNVDAALDVASGRFGIGVIVRNSAGDPCLAAAIQCSGSVGVEITEAKALEEGIKLAVIHDLLPLVIESDASNVVSLCNNLFSSRAEIDNIVLDIRQLCCGFSLGPISYVPCCCNKAAHSLARKALSIGSVVWEFSFPSWLLALVLGDVPVFVGP
ncbi:hypothetical protein ACOSQ4_016714 [Xanthoceras sorbifolium]